MKSLKCYGIRAACYLGKTLTGIPILIGILGIVLAFSIGMVSIGAFFANFIPDWVWPYFVYTLLTIIALAIIYAVLNASYQIGSGIFGHYGINFCNRRSK